MSVEIKLEGAEELARAMKQLPPSLQRKHMRNAIRRGVTLIRDEIKATAPINQSQKVVAYRKGLKRPKPGRLRRLIRIRPHRPRNSYLKVSLFYPKNSGDKKGNDPKNAYYWRFLEYGTVHIAPIGFVRRAADKHFHNVVNTVIAHTRLAVDEELRRARVKKS